MAKPGQNEDMFHLNGYVMEGGGENLVWSAADFENFLELHPELDKSMESELKSVVKLLVQNRWPFRIHATIEKTGRKKLIMAGITSDVCLAFPAISAVAAGYDVYAVIDASGAWNPLVEQAAMLRMSQSGVIVTNWVAIAAELQKDWRLETGPTMGQLFQEHLTFYGMLMNNFVAK